MIQDHEINWEGLKFLEQEPHIRSWSQNVRSLWYRWHWTYGVVGIYHEAETILGVFVGRRVDNEEQARIEYATSQTGHTIFVDQISLHGVSLKDFTLQGLIKFSWINFITFRRLDRSGFKTYPIYAFYNALEKRRH